MKLSICLYKICSKQEKYKDFTEAENECVHILLWYIKVKATSARVSRQINIKQTFGLSKK